MVTTSANLNVMQKTCILASKIILKDFGEIENLQVSNKSIDKFFHYTTSNAVKTIKKELLKARSDWLVKIKFEENEKSFLQDKYYFIVDPINGIENFKNGIPHFSISISIFYNNQIIASSIYDPVKNEFFTAEKGNGAFINGKRIRVSGKRDLESCVFSLNNSLEKLLFKHSEVTNVFEIKNILDEIPFVRCLGSSSLDIAWVASGRLDAFIAKNTSIFDLASGALILKESGGFITDFSSNNSFFKNGEVIAANSLIHGKILKIMKNKNIVN